jgi:hypothetical protein
MAARVAAAVDDFNRVLRGGGGRTRAREQRDGAAAVAEKKILQVE